MFRELRRAVLRANKSILAIDDAALAPLAALGVAVGRGMRVTDAEVAIAFAGEYSEAAAARAEQLARPQLVDTGSRGKKIAYLSFRGIVNYDVEFQPMAVSTKHFARMISELAADDTIKSIVVQVNSPGGTVTGLPEAADAVFAARQVKPVTMVLDPLCASAAYWVASQGTEISVAPSGEVGSIGVRMMHMDCSAALEAEGIKITNIASGEFKTEGNPYEPLPETSRAYFQAECDALYAQFLKAVARGRDTSVANVKENFGKGRVLRAAEAKKLGMVDRLEMTDAAFSRLGLFAADSLATRRADAEAEPTDAAADVSTDHPAETSSQEPAEPVAPVEAAAEAPVEASKPALAWELQRLRYEVDL